MINQHIIDISLYILFSGRDYKALAQIALYLLGPYLSPEEVAVWVALSKVFIMCYSGHYDITKKTQCQALCYDFVRKATSVFPELKRKLKIHLFLHLPECLEKFGPTSCYSAER